MRYILLKIINLITGKYGYEDFANKMRERESGNRYDIKNSLGYLGAYQFGMARLCDLGLTKKVGSSYEWLEGYNEKYFLNMPELQDQCFKDHTADLRKLININFSQYLNKEVDGIYITMAGLIAGSHLGGIGGVRKFLEEGINNQDAYKTSIRDYIISFRDFVL